MNITQMEAVKLNRVYLPLYRIDNDIYKSPKKPSMNTGYTQTFYKKK